MHSAVEVDVIDRFGLRNRRIGDTVGHVGAKPAVFDPDRLAALRIGRLKLFQRARGTASAIFRLSIELDGPGQVDVEDLVFTGQRPGVDALFEVRPELAVLREDLSAALRVDPDDSGKVEQTQSRVEVDGRKIHRFENGCRARLRCGSSLLGRRFLLRLGRARRRRGDLASFRVDDASIGQRGGHIRSSSLSRSEFGGIQHRLRVDFGDVRAESAVFRHDVLAGDRVHADDAIGDDGGLDEFPSLGGGELVGRQIRRNVDAARRGLRVGIGVDHLEVGAVLADAQGDVVGDRDRVDHARVDLTKVVDDLTQTAVLVRAEVEAGQPVDTVGFAGGDAVEVVFHLGGEVVLHQVAEEVFKQPYNREGDPIRDQRLAARGDITAVGDGGDDRRVG